MFPHTVFWVEGTIGQFWEMSDVDAFLQQARKELGSPDSNPALPQSMNLGKSSSLPQFPRERLMIAKVPLPCAEVLNEESHN